jgi:polysaccharide export outer membrane protein
MATIAFPITAWALPLSPGDRIRINIPSDEVLPQNTPETYRFSGIYEVNLDGSISLPLIAPISVVGMESGEINQRIQNSLVQGGYFQPEFIQVSTSIVQWAPIQINVMGATFKPGRILVEPTLTEEEGNTQADRTEPFTVSGEYPPGRFLTAAIRAAGGLKPTADVANIRLIRNGKEQTIDLTGVFTGETFEDVPLIAGDQVIVPELDKVHSELVRPSQVTPSEIAIFVSNQSTSNNDADGGGGEVSTVVYGTRFSQAVVAARCAGGTVSTNANRRVALIQTNRLTGETKILEQEVEELLRNPNNQDVNPHLMPEDSVICYDSNRSDIQGTASFINSILSPFRLIQSIFFGF